MSGSALLATLMTTSGLVRAEVKVVATLPALAGIAKAVGGEHVIVDVLAAETEDPHFVDPRPNLILMLNDADVVLVNGLDLEVAWLQPLLVAARNSQVNVGGRGYFEAATYVQKLEVPTQRVDRSMGDVHPGGNPHIWFDARAGAAIAVAVGDKLAEVDRDHAQDYRSRAARYAGDLRAVASRAATRFAALPKDKRKVISYHRSFPYLFNWLGIEEVIAVEPRPGIAPDPGHVAKVLTTLRSAGARVIVQEEYHPKSTSNTLAKLGPGRLVILPGGPRLAHGQSYADFLEIISEKLYEALSR
jgi:zinc/manganese transport system substrate-binding protein